MSVLSIDKAYRDYKNDVYRYLFYLCRNHHTAEDLTQETFCRAWSHLEQLPEKKVKPWLFRVSHNAYIDKLRKESRSSSYENEFFYQFAGEETPETWMLREESRQELYSQLLLLNLNQRQAVLLYDIHGFSYQEAANLMEISLSKFKITLYRARQRLRNESKATATA
ncbi:sigma-70 family RNA polymerase sigma factor [Paenibacillus woosongensis]|uniref:Sigma-70 family RNA polymerase sigma factor n=1 Tax=Paenibacillus woosongensis TaxID=307580 RepID=A0A7X3CMY5_9BACL|nr:sigma-70 family RNA polymerase sigma factor [Paenibacillus woosongensis]MUG45685.1 sigma-70 family RNA polymerase sigma factor [Paenibacillus woosongensis]WHX51217.1 sigma-70 family RNA polymerase sigma factor [Paenibacillus woosongensis]